MMNDSISDLIIRIKNGGAAKKSSVSMPYSNLTWSIAEKLADRGYTKAPMKKGKEVKHIELELVYNENGQPRITGVKRMSHLSKRIYKGFRDIHRVKQGYGSLVISTPKGIMMDDEARKAKVGGEILFSIW
ncbi:MAG TPA: 30S ribosomal protein S8 [Candidatus Paceibacterota bacterium]|nr:30S ribosomal protein S8 [Candidatus Paceibacterota bacterium]